MQPQTWIGNAWTSRDRWGGDRQRGTTGAGESNCNRADVRMRACERACVCTCTLMLFSQLVCIFGINIFRCLSITPQKKSDFHN